jgi:predicted nucleic acid-binding protein
MLLTLDASVICKWYLDPSAEPAWEQAHAVGVALAESQVDLIQPPHWIAEVASVVARLAPASSQQVIEDLWLINAPVLQSPQVYSRAARIAIETGTHLFDTLYHAVALEAPGCNLVTADERYWKVAKRYGQITLLRDWER